MTYDAIIIGGGHNGLVAAGYLARAGKSVCVLERRDVLGGCATTEELYPGFHFSPAAYVVSLLLPEVIEDLRLRQFGYEVLRRDPSSISFDGRGNHLVLGHDAAKNHASIARFSERDAEALPKYEAMLTRIAERLEPLLREPPPLMPSPDRRPGLVKRAGTLISGLRTAGVFNDLMREDPAVVEVLTGAADRILDRWFESDLLKATLATDAIIGAFHAPSTPGSAYVLLHHVMGDAGGARGVWGYIRGGMGGLAAALKQSCEQLGVTIRTGVEVQRIIVEGGSATGVATHAGTYHAKAVASNVDANQTLLRLVDAEHLDQAFRERVGQIDYASASGKINLALDGVPDFSGGGVLDADLLRGTIHTTPDMAHIERACEDARRGAFSREPVLEITMPSIVDDTIAPPGKQIMSIFVQYAPYKLSGGQRWDEVKPAWVDSCIDRLAKFAPDIRERILFTHAMTPVDLERRYGLTGGNIMQGAMHLHQLGPMRPLAGWSDHRTPIDRLYLCGAASHPGGGVMGACGRNAAREMLRDL